MTMHKLPSTVYDYTVIGAEVCALLSFRLVFPLSLQIVSNYIFEFELIGHILVFIEVLQVCSRTVLRAKTHNV